MCEGAVLNRLAAANCIGRKILRVKVSADFAIAADLEVIGQVRTFADKRDAAVQQVSFQLVWRHIIAVANLALLANDDLFIYDRVVDHAAGTDDGIEEQDGIPYDRALLNNHTW